MEKINIEEKLNKKILELPEEAKKVIEKIPWAQALSEIGKKYSLDITKQEDLYIEAYLVIIGEQSPEEFSLSIKNRLSLKDDELEEIVSYLNEKIFIPLGEEISKAFPDSEEGVEDEDTIKSSLENPPSSKPISFVEQKMAGTHSLDQKSSPIPVPPGEKYSDPYREQF